MSLHFCYCVLVSMPNSAAFCCWLMTRLQDDQTTKRCGGPSLRRNKSVPGSECRCRMSGLHLLTTIFKILSAG